MDRRELLRTIAALTGAAFVGGDRVFAAASATGVYAPAQVALLDEIAETILPRTDTPGAKDAQVGAYIARYSAACYNPTDLAVLRAGLVDIDARSHKAYGIDFIRCTGKQKETLLVDIDAEAKRHAREAGDNRGQPPHWFTLCKQLTLMSFFTSEAGATRVARYRPVPGPYKGVVPYKGETFWAW
ncbi:MAG: gluconate 2-dehydrogenase subunit 3 family protein [Rudaea sp.]|uniref:gluconate 2-dehydrogenase subunit 3 family protein n=1 Tax=Rudaea sp. TaxID=2136325 RepID=UPI0039E6B680